MKYREWLVGGIRLVSSYHFESQMLIEMMCGCVFLILVDISDGCLLQGELDKSFT